MNIKIIPKKLKGEIKAIPSKSHGHRLLICAALAGNIKNTKIPVFSEDMEATKDVMTNLCGKNGILNCRESGSTLRFVLPVAMVLKDEAVFNMEGRLSERPLSPLKEEMEKHGCHFNKNENKLTVKGKMSGGTFNLSGDVSSQFITGLLLALPLVPEGGTIKITSPLQSRPYVDITLKVLRDFGIKIEEKDNTFFVEGNQKYCCPKDLTVEGDWSNGAFWIVAKALGSNVTCTGLNPLSPQGDKAIVDLLAARKIDATNIPDLIPILSVKAAVSEGKTFFENAQRLRIKESDRLGAIFENLMALGGNVEETDDGLIITGTGINGGQVSGHNDHRMVMSMAIAATVSNKPITILGAEAVNKSYPNFFDDYKKLGGEIIEI